MPTIELLSHRLCHSFVAPGFVSTDRQKFVKWEQNSQSNSIVRYANNGTRNVIFIFNYLFIVRAGIDAYECIIAKHNRIYHFYWEFHISLAFNSNRFFVVACFHRSLAARAPRLQFEWNRPTVCQTKTMESAFIGSMQFNNWQIYFVNRCDWMRTLLLSLSVHQTNELEKSMDLVFMPCNLIAFHHKTFIFILINGYQLFVSFHFCIECHNWFQLIGTRASGRVSLL